MTKEIEVCGGTIWLNELVNNSKGIWLPFLKYFMSGRNLLMVVVYN